MKLSPGWLRREGSPPAEGWLDSWSAKPPAVWAASVPQDEPTLEWLAGMLSGAERRRAQQLRLAGDRQRFVTGRGWLRFLLGKQMKIPATTVDFQYAAAGKPRVAPVTGKGVEFNLAHSGEVVVLAFHPEIPVGVDVEEIRADMDAVEVARNTFPHSEYLAWLALKGDERQAYFFRKWTRHEARLKALGCGITGRAQPTAAHFDCFELELPDGYTGFACLAHK